MTNTKTGLESRLNRAESALADARLWAVKSASIVDAYFAEFTPGGADSARSKDERPGCQHCGRVATTECVCGECCDACYDSHMPPTGDESAVPRFQTRPVLAGAYRGKRLSLRATLTHLVDTVADGEVAMCGKAPNCADRYSVSGAELNARPKCPACARKWDYLVGGA